MINLIGFPTKLFLIFLTMSLARGCSAFFASIVGESTSSGQRQLKIQSSYLFEKLFKLSNSTIIE